MRSLCRFIPTCITIVHRTTVPCIKVSLVRTIEDAHSLSPFDRHEDFDIVTRPIDGPLRNTIRTTVLRELQTVRLGGSIASASISTAITDRTRGHSGIFRSPRRSDRSHSRSPDFRHCRWSLVRLDLCTGGHRCHYLWFVRFYKPCTKSPLFA